MHQVLVREPVRGRREGTSSSLPSLRMQLSGGWLMPNPPDIFPAWEPDSFTQVTD